MILAGLPIQRSNKVILLLTDALLISLALHAGYFWRMGHFELLFEGSTGFWLILAVHLTTSYVLGLFDLESNSSRVTLGIQSLLSVTLSFAAIVFINYLVGKERSGIFGRGVLAASLLFAGCFSWGVRSWFLSWFRRQISGQKLLIVLSQRLKEKVLLEFKKILPPEQYSLVEVNELESLQMALEKKWQAVVVVAQPWDITKEVSRLLMNARWQGLRVFDSSHFFEKYCYRVPISFLEESWFIRSDGFRIFQKGWSIRLKRLSDLILALTLLVLTLPLILVTYILVQLESPGPVLFRQIRTGLDRRPFEILKMRSMTLNAEKDGAQWAQVNDQRILRVGKWMRKMRIDELPQLINIIRGEMSFIGPRPERPEFDDQLEKVIPFYALRNMVRPGLTGWAQVHYPYGSSVEDSAMKLQFDLYYIKHASLILDLVILIKTFKVVFGGRGR